VIKTLSLRLLVMFKIRVFKGHTIDIVALKFIFLTMEALGLNIYNIL